MSNTDMAASASSAIPPVETPFRATMALCFLVAIIEGFDIQTAGVVAPRLAPALGLGPAEMGLFFSSATLGLIAGAVIGGRMADRFGRKATLIPALLLFGLFSLGTAFADGFTGLFVMRFMTGLGIGGAFPSLIAIVAENARSGRIAAAVAVLYAGLPAGGAVASLVSTLGAHGGWQIIFIIGGIAPLFVAPLLYWILPHDRPAPRSPEARATPLAALFGRTNLNNTLLLWLGFFCALGVHGLLLNWLPTLLVTRGIDKAGAGIVQILFNVAGATGSVFAGRAMVAFRPSLVVAAAFAGLALALAIIADAPAQLGFMLAAGVLVGLGSMGVQGIIYGLAPRLYPTEARGTGVGAAMAVGRFGSVVGPIFAGFLMAAGGGSAGVLLGVLPIVLVGGIATFAIINRDQQLKLS
ncbi:MAG: 3-(3-hydroxy-phenyl)propionate transporter MhpT [Sphingobium sp.]